MTLKILLQKNCLSQTNFLPEPQWNCGGALQQQIEDPGGLLPVGGVRVFELGVQDLEGAGEGDAQAADEPG